MNQGPLGISVTVSVPSSRRCCRALFFPDFVLQTELCLFVRCALLSGAHLSTLMSASGSSTDASPAPPPPSSVLVDRFLDVFDSHVLPLTREGVRTGNRVFGAAILLKSTLEVVAAGTNRASENPLHHGEVSCLNAFYAIPAAARPDTKDCYFLSSHEPCKITAVAVRARACRGLVAVSAACLLLLY